MSARVLSAGDSFADYTIVRQIGVGGFGAVYEAEHPMTGRSAALKITHPHVAEDDDSRARAVQEARALGELHHPNIVAIQNAGTTPDGSVWIAMELLKGWTLRELRARGPLPVEQALAILAEICDGLAAAHDIQIIHRDLKPENVFVTKQMAVKVLDFTAAKAAGRNLVRSTGEMAGEGGTRRVIGTLAYMSPEQVRGERVDARTDIYSLGVLGYELMGPFHPHANRDGSLPDDLEVARRHDAVEPVPLPEVAAAVPSHVWDVLRRALAKGRKDRLPSMQRFAAELRDARACYLKDRNEAAVAFAQEWRGAGSFARYGVTEPPEADARAPRQPSRRVVLSGSGAVAEQSERSAARGSSRPESRRLRAMDSGAPMVVHITAARPHCKARARARRVALWSLLAAGVLLLGGAALAWQLRLRTHAAPADHAGARP